MNLTQVVARTLAACGVTELFGLMGSGNLRLIHHLVDEHGAAFHNARHESGAVAAADGYARVSGNVGVVLVTHGPAFTNAITPLVTAQRARTPLVLVAADSTGVSTLDNPMAALQALDQPAVLRAVGVPVHHASPGTAAGDVSGALADARRRSSPVGLMLPTEHETSPADGEAASAPAGDGPVPPAPDGEALGRAAALIAAAERPVVLAGLGAVRAGAREPLERLAEHVGAVLATSLRGVGYFAGNPYDAGIAGGFSPPAVEELLRSADCVAAFGASLNYYTTLGHELFARAGVIQCDADPAALGRHASVTLGLAGDARVVAERLLAEVAEVTGPRQGLRTAAVRELLQAKPAIEPFEDVSRTGAVDPRALCARLDALIPEDRTVVTDGGIFAYFPISHLSIPAPDALLFTMDGYGAVGGGLGAAIGAAVGRPDRLSVLFIGDGGLFMTLGDLDLAIRERLPLLIVCMNDGAYGSELLHLRREGFPPDGAIFDTPDLAEVARAMGAGALRITDLDQLDGLPARLASLDGPLLLDCTLTRDVVSVVRRRRTI